MTVASDTSVASIFRPASGPRTPADASKKEGTGTFGMMVDQTTRSAKAPAPKGPRADASSRREDRPAGTATRRNPAHPVANRHADKPKAATDSPKADGVQDRRTSDATPMDTKSTDTKPTDTKPTGAAAVEDSTSTAPPGPSGDAQDTAPQTPTAAAVPVETPADPSAMAEAAAEAGVATAEAVGETIVKKADDDTAPASTDATQDTKGTDAVAAAIPVAADTNTAPVPAMMLPATAPAAPAEAAEGGGDAIAATTPASTEGAAQAINAPQSGPTDAAAKSETPAPVSGAASNGDAKTKVKSETTAETKPEAKSDTRIDSKPDTSALMKTAAAESTSAADGKAEPVIKFSNNKTDGSTQPAETRDGHRAEKHPAVVNREIVAEATAKAADTALAAAKAGLESVQNLNATAAAAQPSAPALQINTVTAAAASAATANNMPSSAVPIDGVAVEIAAQSQNGKNSFEIRLDPQELGRIDVRLDVDRDGNVTTKLIVDRAETLDLLKRDASNIERTLQDAGLKTSDNTLQFSLRDQQSFTGNDRNNGTGATTARIVLPDDDGVPLEAVRSNYGRLLGLGRGVDISI